MRTVLPGQTVRLLLTFLGLCFAAGATAQQSFEPGYVVDATGQRSEVYILNEDWRFNPTEITIRKAEDQEPFTLATRSLAEFGIGDKARYVHYTLAIEKSATQTSRLSMAAPIAKTERVLLRVEVAGAASLYSYLTMTAKKYFLGVGEMVPTQLIFTRTLVGGGGVSESRAFVQQLRTQLACDDNVPVDEQLKYSLQAIKPLVIMYNSCVSGHSQVYENETPGARSFYLTLLPGVYATDFKLLTAGNGTPITDMRNSVVPRLGVDLEYVLPFGGNKLALLARPSYYRFSSSGPYFPVEGTIAEVAYSALDLPISFRYYSFLNQDLKLFGTLSLGITVPMDRYNNVEDPVFEMDARTSFATEFGLRLQDRWGLSVAYEHNGNGLISRAYTTRTPGVRMMLGYTL